MSSHDHPAPASFAHKEEHLGPAAHDEPAKRQKGPLREFLETVALALLIFLLVRTFLMNYRVIGSSMQPTIQEGYYLLIDKLFYSLGAPARGDIVVLHPPNLPGQIYVKRIIGLPGDTVELRDGQLLINEDPILEPWTTRPAPGLDWGPSTVEPERLFVLGDNRPGSRDSRFFGTLTRDHILGRALLCYWPPAEWAFYPRYPPARLGLPDDGGG